MNFLLFLYSFNPFYDIITYIKPIKAYIERIYVMKTMFKLREQNNLPIVLASLDSKGGILESIKRDDNNFLVITADFVDSEKIKHLSKIVELLNQKP